MTGVVIGALSLAAWIYLAIGRGSFWRVGAFDTDITPTRNANLCAVIPARDEAATISAAVFSLAAQGIRTIVVDDHSSDATAVLARDAGAIVIAAPPLPPGWTGKLWAASHGVAGAESFAPDYLLLTDADIVHERGTPVALVAHIERGYDLASLMVRLKMDTFAERAMMPAFVFFFLMLYPPRWTADPHSKTAGAAGGCMLVRAEALRRAGGIAAIRGELIDDCALAAAIKRTGGRVWMGLAAGTCSVRDYSGFPAIWRMIARTAYTQLRYSPVLLTGTLLGMAAVYIAPVVLVCTGGRTARVLGATAWALMAALYCPTLRLYRRSLLWAPALPLIAGFYTGATLDSALHHWRGKGGQWKGRAQAQART